MAKHEVTSLSFAGGLNKKADPKALKENQTTQADNVIYQTAGIVRKRGGFTTVKNDITGGYRYQQLNTDEFDGVIPTLPIADGTALEAVNAELCFTSDKKFYTYSEVSDSWIARGDVSPPSVDRFDSVSINKNQLFTTARMISNYYADVGNLRCIVGHAQEARAMIGFWDKLKAEWVVPPAQIPNGNLPVVVAHNDIFRVYSLATTSPAAELYVNAISPTSVISAQNVASVVLNFTATGITVPIGVSGLDFRHGVDAAATNGTYSYVVITGPTVAASNPGTTGPSINRVAVFDTATATAPLVTMRATLLTERVSLSANEQSVVLSGFSGVTLVFSGFAPTTGFTVIDVKVATMAPGIDQGNARGQYCLTGLAASLTQFTGTLTAGMFLLKQKRVPSILATGNADGVIGGSGNFLMDYGTFISSSFSFITTNRYPWPEVSSRIDPISKPRFDRDLGWVAWFDAMGPVDDNTEQTNTLMTLDGTLYNANTPFVPGVRSIVSFNEARPAQPIGTTLLPNFNFMQVQPTTLGIIVPEFNANSLVEIQVPTVVTNTVFTPIGDMPIRPRRRIIPLDRGAFITGTRPSYYDGADVRALGYETFPQIKFAANGVISTTAITGNLGTQGASWEYKLIYRYFDAAGKENLSAATQQTITGSVTLTTTAQYIVFNVPEPPLYVTETDVVQAVIYRTTATDKENFRELGLFTLAPPPGPGNVYYQYVDNTSDANLVASSPISLYTDAENDNYPPPACSIAVASQQRIFVVSDERPEQVHFSKTFVPNRAPEFTGEFMIIDPNSGPITGLGVIDTNLIVFKERVIYVVTGNGPDRSGLGNFNAPVVIWSDDGCINPDSVLVTAIGIFYESARGIQLMDRSQQNQYIGAQVEEYTRNNRVLSAIIVPEQSQVRFFMIDGTVLVYDYLLTLWSRFTSVDGIYANAATVWNGKPTFLEQAREIIAIETMDNFVDAGGYSTATPVVTPQPITMTLETGWVKFAGLSTWNRLRRVAALGEFKSSNSANLSFAYDYNPTYLDVVNFTTGTVIGTSGDSYHWRARTPRQVMQAVRFKLVDSPVFTVTATTPYTISNNAESYNLAGLTLEWATKGGISRMPDNKSK